MAFPTIPTVANGRIVSRLNTAGGANKSFTDPFASLTFNAGDLLIAIVFEYDGNSTDAEFSNWSQSFIEFEDEATTTTLSIGAAYKWATGSETGAFTVTTADTSTNDSALILMSIPGAHASTPPEAGGYATGTAAAANPAALNPTGWDIEDTLWIAAGGCGEDSTTGSFTGVASAPANFTNYFDTGISADVVGGIEGAVAFRHDPVVSEDVGPFSVDTTNARNAALTIAVRPAATVSDVKVTDTFDRADNDTVGNDSNGNAWIERAGDWDISSNRVIQTDAGTVPGCLLCGTDPADNTHWVEATVGTGDDGSDQIGLLVRLDPTVFTCLSFEVADGAYKLLEVSAGSPNTIFTGSAHEHSSGEVYACEINTAGTVSFYLNGTQVATTTAVGFNLGDTRIGLHINADVGNNTASWTGLRGGVGPYPGPAGGSTDANAETATATGQAFDATVLAVWPPLLVMPTMVPVP